MTEELIGRDSLLAELRELVAAEGIVTLRGPGGVGKTTVGRELQRREEAPFVELEACNSIDEIYSAVGEVLGVPEALRSPEGVRDAVRHRKLLILDNAEQAVDAVCEVATALSEGGETTIVVTSREPLGAPGEVVVDVEPLDSDEALQLFTARARRFQPDFDASGEASAELQRLLDVLDGIPLALELAAARVRIMTPAQIVERLDERFDVLRNRGAEIGRHETLDACVDWSWGLLDDELRSALADLAIFRGRFTLEEAEAVVEASGWVGEQLDELTERSLVSVERDEAEVAFRVYDAVRRYVDRRHEPSPELAERYARHLLDHARAGTLEHTDLFNVTYAFDLTLAHDAALAVELLIAARRRLWRAGFSGHISGMVRRVLALEDLDPMWKAAAQGVMAQALYAQMQFDQMEDALEAASALLDGDDRDWARRTKALIAMLKAVRRDETHRFDEADVMYERALAHLDVMFAESQAHLLAACALAALRRRKPQESVRHFEACIKAARRCPDPTLLARALSWSANGYIASGRHAHAAQLLREALSIYERRDDVVSRSVAEYGLALALLRDDRDAAVEMAHQAAKSAEECGLRIHAAMTKVLVARLEADATSAEVIRRQLRVFSPDANQNGRWLAWLSLIIVLVRRGDLDIAAQEAEFLYSAVERVASDEEQRSCSRYLATVHALRGDLESMESACDDEEFLEVVRRSLKAGRVSEEDLEAYEDHYMRYIHDQTQLPLEVLAEGLARKGGRPELKILDDGSRAVLPDGQEVDLGPRYVLRRLLLALCDAREETPGRSMSVDELIDAGWPDEKMSYDSAVRRVYSAIRNLRKLGLEEIVLTGEEGYLIDPEIELVRE